MRNQTKKNEKKVIQARSLEELEQEKIKNLYMEIQETIYDKKSENTETVFVKVRNYATWMGKERARVEYLERHASIERGNLRNYLKIAIN